MRKSFIHLIFAISTLGFCAQSAEGFEPSFNSISEANSEDKDFVLENLEAGIADNNGNTPLITAVESWDIELVKSLVASGEDINFITKTKKCAIISALPNPEMLKFLINAGADIEIKLQQRKTPLHYAIGTVLMSSTDFYFESFLVLLENGADVDAIDLYGRTPLHSGIRNKKITTALLDFGASLNIVDDTGWSPLHRAYEQCEFEIIEELSKRGVSLSEFSPGGCNALHYACCHYDRLNLIRFLIEDQKMDVNQYSLWNGGQTGGPTPFLFAVGALGEDDFDVLEYLLEQGANINAEFYMFVGKKRWPQGTVLGYATQYYSLHRYAIQWLREHGAK